jgi:drug/metabolite transporter (DMT)-like permease
MVFLAACLWSTSGLFIKLVSWHPVVIAGLRSLTAFLFMLAVRLIFPPRGEEKNARGPLWAGAAVYALTMLSFVIANKLTASANVIMLQYSAPIWAALIGWGLIGERPRWEHWGALVLVMGGLALFFREGLAGGGLLGDCIALLSGVLFGAHSVILRMMKKGRPQDSMLLAHGLNFAFCIPFLFFYTPPVSASGLFPILFMGIFQVGCASFLFSAGIKRIPAIQAMLTAMIEPILNPLWVLLVTGERPSPSALLGGAVIIAAVAGSSLAGKRALPGGKRGECLEAPKAAPPEDGVEKAG